MQSLVIDKSWTLFLDRDGVINEHRPGYISDWNDFAFTPQALPSIARLSRIFGQVVVITNQQGIGKGLMNEEDLERIFEQMNAAILKAGGKVDAYYYCPHRAEENCICRKPATGMAGQAKADFPEINFKKSIMVGDQISDLQFGKAVGMKTTYISQKILPNAHQALADFQFSLLADFANWVMSKFIQKE